MNTYDFDKTIFYPDSSACFYRYCLRRFPRALIPTLPGSLKMVLRYRRGRSAPGSSSSSCSPSSPRSGILIGPSVSSGTGMRSGSANGIWIKSAATI